MAGGVNEALARCLIPAGSLTRDSPQAAPDLPFIEAGVTTPDDLFLMEHAMKLATLRELYVKELRDLYSAENQLIKALPKMAKAASSPDLKAAFQEHLEQTKGQLERLETIFEKLEVSPKGKKCKAMEGLIEEGKELTQEDVEPDVLDAGLIAAAQKVEHYEIATYGCVRTYAKLMGEDDAAELLQETLNEEGETDEKLTELAETGINVEAMEEEEEIAG
jgi:ferritin-like metal-binding protein YciE